jgi:hypothetical protein
MTKNKKYYVLYAIDDVEKKERVGETEKEGI